MSSVTYLYNQPLIRSLIYIVEHSEITWYRIFKAKSIKSDQQHPQSSQFIDISICTVGNHADRH